MKTSRSCFEGSPGPEKPPIPFDTTHMHILHTGSGASESKLHESAKSGKELLTVAVSDDLDYMNLYM